MNKIELKEYWKQIKHKPITCMHSFILGYDVAVAEIKRELDNNSR